MGPSTTAELETPLERERELTSIRGLLEQAAVGRGGLVLFEGPAGIGKTRLLQVAAGLARTPGADVLRAAGGELERELAFGVALQLFEPRMQRATRAERAELLSGAAALAAPLLRLSRRSPDERAEATSLLHGLFWVTCNLAERAPVLITVDDAQWADRSSLEWLLYLAQRIEELPVALVLAGRPAGPGPVGEVLTRLAAHPLGRTLRLAPLSERGVRALARERLGDCSDEFVHACLRASGGIPFLLRELLTALQAEHVSPTGEAARRVAELAPEAIVRSVLIRLAGLPAAAASLARAVAVLGDDAALRHAAVLAGLDVDSVAGLLEALDRAGILEPGEPLTFVHPLLRSSLAAEIPQLERERMHRQAARLLATEGAAAERVAAHLLHARQVGDRWVVVRLREAGRAALARGSPSSAAAYLRRALAEPPPASVRAQLLVELADAEMTGGELGAPDRLTEAASLVQAHQERARVLLLLGRALYLQDRLQEAAETFDRGLTQAAGDEQTAAELQAGWLSVARLVPSLRDEAQARTAPLRDRPMPGKTHAERLVFDGEPRDRTRELAVRALGGTALLEDETSDGTAWMIASVNLGRCEDYASAEPVIEAALADARRRGSVTGFTRASYMSAWIASRAGSLVDALADAQQAAATAHRYGWWYFGPAIQIELARILMERGELEAAAIAIGRAQSDPRWAKTSWQGFILCLRGELRLRQGQPADAMKLLVAAGEAAVAAGVANPAVCHWRSGAALAAIQLGKLDDAERLATEEVKLARRFGAPGALGVALRAHGLVQGGAAGIDLLRDATTSLERSRSRLEHARALVDLGAAIRRRGRRADARKPLAQGLDMAHRVGATIVERQARDELLASGARPRRAALRGVQALTPSEHRVAQMAAAGNSNREIAQALFVTLRTVEGHLTRAYDKLGIRSREQLLAALALPSASRRLNPGD